MPPSYRRLQQWAIAISIASIVYNGAEGAISIGFGAESHSHALVFFGIQSAIEVTSAAIVIWRFKILAKPGEEKRATLGEPALLFEKRATITIGGLLIALSLATEAVSIATLAVRQHPDPSNSSLIISASALVIMIMIWLPKRYLARALDSSTMRGEATCSLSCIQITIVLFVGSLVYRLWKGGWWVNGATSIILGLLFGWEGVKMISWALDPQFSGGCCEDCKPVALEEGQVELGEQYREICGCCLEKDECKRSDACQCSASEVEVDGADACCTPLTRDGSKCCTRAIRRRSQDLNGQRSPRWTANRHGASTTSIQHRAEIDACFSPAPQSKSNAPELASKKECCPGCRA